MHGNILHPFPCGRQVPFALTGDVAPSYRVPVRVFEGGLAVGIVEEWAAAFLRDYGLEVSGQAPLID